MRVTSRWTTRLVTSTLVGVLLASAGFAQVRWNGYRRNRMPPRFRQAGHHDNGFTFCRLKYTSVRYEDAGRGWRTDYPAADVNFMIRLSELTSTNVDFDDRHSPNHWVVEMAISEFPKGRKYLISLSFRGKASVRPAQVGGFDVNIVIHGSTAVRGRGDLVAYR